MACVRGGLHRSRVHRADPRNVVSTVGDTLRRYRFFREQGSMRVGHAAEDALSLARAEQEADRRGWTWDALPEEERYADVYGDDPPPGTDFYCIVARDADGDPIARLRFVGDHKRQNLYWRVVAAELFSEALARWPLGRVGATCTEARP